MFDVVVLGGGVIGLTSARSWQQRGARVCVVTSRPVEETTSHVAAAVWYPTGMAADPWLLRTAGRTFDVFARQAAEGVPGVRFCDTRMFSRAEPGEPWWSEVVPGFRGGSAPEPFTEAWRFRVPLVEMPVYLDWLRSRLLAAGGTLVTGQVDEFAQLAPWAPVVINASGLAARQLCGDEAVHPVRGQVIVASNPGLTTSVRDEDNPRGRTYVHPRSQDVVIGGTYEPGNWDTAVDRSTATEIWSRAVELVPRLRESTVLAHRVGLRPARDGGVRLHRDTETLPGTTLIHNYGHAGAGMTLSWGCAEEAVDAA